MHAISGQRRPSIRALFGVLLSLLIATLALNTLQPVYAASASLNLSLSTSFPIVKSGEWAIINLGYSCSSVLNTPCEDAVVTTVLPPELSGAASDVQALGAGTTTTYNQATRTVTWTFDAPINAGDAGRLELRVKFPAGTTADGTVATLRAEMRSSTAAPKPSNQLPITALAEAEVTADKSFISGGTPDVDTTYQVQVCIPGEGSGALNLTNVLITDTLPLSATFVSASGSGVYNSTPGVVTWPATSLSVPGSLCATRTVVVRFPSSVPIGTLLRNDLNVSAQAGSTTLLLSAFDVRLLQPPTPDYDFSKTGPDSALVGDTVTYSFSTHNSGTAPLDDVVVVDPIPAELEVSRFSAGSHNISPAGSVRLELEYTTNLTPTYTAAPGGPFSTASCFTVAPITATGCTAINFAEGARITNLRWRYLDPLPFAFESTTHSFRALVTSTPINSIIVNQATSTYSTVTVSAPSGYVFTAPNQGSDTDRDSDTNASGVMASTILTSSERDLSWDAGLFRPASLGNVVWVDTDADGQQDAGELGLNNVSLSLSGVDGSGATVSLTTTTSSTGAYSFTDLAPGAYTVTVSAPSGYRFSVADNADDTSDSDADPTTGVMASTTLTSGQADPTWDAGLYQLASLGDFVWVDTNGDGLQNDGPTGLSGVSLSLRGVDGSGATVSLSTTTDANGVYTFTNLVPGTYTVTATAPGGYVFTAANEGGDTSDSDADPTTGVLTSTVLVSGQNAPTWDAGLIYTAGLGNRVWLDRDANGLQDTSEVGLPNVTVTLYAEDGQTVLDTTTTDADGFYFFANLAPGVYLIAFTPPAGYELSPLNQGGNPASDSDAITANGRTAPITLTLGETDLDWDAGLFQLLRLGNLVWDDLDNSGTLNGSEVGLSGVEIRLFSDADTDNLPDGPPIALTTTDNSGHYRFDNLRPGHYLVELTAPTAYSSSTGVNGSALGPSEPAPDRDNDRDGDDNGSVVGASIRSIWLTLASQSEPDNPVDGDDTNSNLSLDFGLFRHAVLGSTVWYDRNGNGRKDADEPGVPDVIVTLYDNDGNPILNAQGNPITRTTGADGVYLFDYLIPGVYWVSFSNLPPGYTFTTPGVGDPNGDSDADPLTGLSGPVSLEPGEEDPHSWAGLINPTALSLSSFTGERTGTGVNLRWVTGDERQTLGFQLWRSTDGIRTNAIQVTTTRIDVRSDPQGDTYTWLDSSAVTGQSYHYWIEELRLDGSSREYGPLRVSGEVPGERYRTLMPLIMR